jgi:hypothetical protein
VLWGSEYPVLYWRGEQIEGARDWLGELGIQMDAGERARYLGGNTERLFFADPAPEPTLPDLPNWLASYPRTRPIQVGAPLNLPPDVYAPILSAYLQRNTPEKTLSFAEYLVEQLTATASH